MKKLFTKLSTALIVASALFGTQAFAKDKVTVFAAASLTNAVDEIVGEYNKTNDADIVTSYTSSSTLARQIEQGAPVDIFISADQRWMNYLTDKKMMDDNTRVTLLANKLVLIAPKDSKIDKVEINKETDWLKLLDGGKLSVGDPDHVPAGIYTKQAFTYFGQWDAIVPTLARADNVRNALFLVERSEAPLGTVYGSDAMISQKVKIVGEFPVASHDPVEYPMAIVKGHDNKAVTDFYDYLKSDNAKVIFVKYGFSPL